MAFSFGHTPQVKPVYFEKATKVLADAGRHNSRIWVVKGWGKTIIYQRWRNSSTTPPHNDTLSQGTAGIPSSTRN